MESGGGGWDEGQAQWDGGAGCCAGNGTCEEISEAEVQGWASEREAMAEEEADVSPPATTGTGIYRATNG